jgi:hypothetical protein
MTRRLVILYEDSRGPTQRFPLHELVVKSAADLVSLDLHELLRRVIAVPKNGVNKVLEDVRRSDRFRAMARMSWSGSTMTASDGRFSLPRVARAKR